MLLLLSLCVCTLSIRNHLTHICVHRQQHGTKATHSLLNTKNSFEPCPFRSSFPGLLSVVRARSHLCLLPLFLIYFTQCAHHIPCLLPASNKQNTFFLFDLFSSLPLSLSLCLSYSAGYVIIIWSRNNSTTYIYCVLHIYLLHLHRILKTSDSLFVNFFIFSLPKINTYTWIYV